MYGNKQASEHKLVMSMKMRYVIFRPADDFGKKRIYLELLHFATRLNLK